MCVCVCKREREIERERGCGLNYTTAKNLRTMPYTGLWFVLYIETSNTVVGDSLHRWVVQIKIKNADQSELCAVREHLAQDKANT